MMAVGVREEGSSEAGETARDLGIPNGDGGAYVFCR
jgi:hypothetical protein